MKTPTRKEAAALAKQEAIGAAELNREQWWHMLPLRDRERALSVAHIDPARAALPMATFTDDERARVRFAIQTHVTQMQLIALCMCGHNTNVHGFLH